MPLAADAYAEIAPPMLTCVQKKDGFQFELMITVPQGQADITRVRIGPYRFRDEFRPKSSLGGILRTGGPENAFLMHVSAPPGWSRARWESASDEDGNPVYLTWSGHLEPGSTGVFRFKSLYRPGGLRTGLILTRGAQDEHYGVTGPNYERFEVNVHGHH